MLLSNLTLNVDPVFFDGCLKLAELDPLTPQLLSIIGTSRGV